MAWYTEFLNAIPGFTSVDTTTQAADPSASATTDNAAQAAQLAAQENAVESINAKLRENGILTQTTNNKFYDSQRQLDSDRQLLENINQEIKRKDQEANAVKMQAAALNQAGYTAFKAIETQGGGVSIAYSGADYAEIPLDETIAPMEFSSEEEYEAAMRDAAMVADAIVNGAAENSDTDELTWYETVYATAEDIFVTIKNSSIDLMNGIFDALDLLAMGADLINMAVNGIIELVDMVTEAVKTTTRIINTLRNGRGFLAVADAVGLADMYFCKIGVKNSTISPLGTVAPLLHVSGFIRRSGVLTKTLVHAANVTSMTLGSMKIFSRACRQLGFFVENYGLSQDAIRSVTQAELSARRLQQAVADKRVPIKLSEFSQRIMKNSANGRYTAQVAGVIDTGSIAYTTRALNDLVTNVGMQL